MEKEIASNCKANPHSILEIYPTKTKKRLSITDLVNPGTEHDPVITTNDQEKAEVFLEYFSSVFTKEPDATTMHFFDTKDYKTEQWNIAITKQMVMDTLKKLKINKSPGPDAIPPRVIHEISSSIATPIIIMFQTSLSNMGLPTEWKHAQISAIHKNTIGQSVAHQSFVRH